MCTRNTLTIVLTQKKLVLCLTIVAVAGLVFALAGTAPAAIFDDGEAADHLVSSSNNWNPDSVPTGNTHVDSGYTADMNTGFNVNSLVLCHA